mgnify:CR=1 FL=1
METLVEYDIAGVDFSAGITITGLQGDRINGAMKVEFVGNTTGGGGDILLGLNGDTTSFSSQYLRSSSSTVNASSGTSNIISDNAKGRFGTVVWIYPQSGQNRPMLVETNTEATIGSLYQIFKKAIWFNNTADELTSMKIYSNTANAQTAKIRISVPKGTKMASPSAILTVN